MTPPFTGCGACVTIIYFDAPSRGYASTGFADGSDLYKFFINTVEILKNIAIIKADE